MMRKVFVLVVGAFSSVFSVANASAERRSSDPTPIVDGFPSRLMDRIQKIKNGFRDKESLTDDDHCELIGANKYLLARNWDNFLKIESIEEKADSMNTLEEIQGMDLAGLVASLTAASTKETSAAELAKEICEDYEALRLNGRYVLWSCVAQKLQQ